MLVLEIFVQVQTFRRRPFVPSHNFCHPDMVCNMTSLAVIGARPLTPPSPQGCLPPAILDKRCLRRFFRSETRCQQNVATYPGGQRRNKDRAVKKTQRKIRQFFTLLPNMCIFTLLCVKIIIFVNFYTFECKS